MSDASTLAHTTDGDFRITVEPGMTTEGLIAMCGFGIVDPRITSETFAFDPSMVGEWDIRLYGILTNDERFSPKWMASVMRDEGFPAARHENGLLFVHAFPKVQLTHSLALLGSSAELPAKLGAQRHHICFFRDSPEERTMYAGIMGSELSSLWRCIGAKRVSGP